jgi:hypothetical protein
MLFWYLQGTRVAFATLLLAITHHDFEVSYTRGIPIVSATELCRSNKPVAIGTGDSGSNDCNSHCLHIMSILLSNSPRSYAGLG